MEIHCEAGTGLCERSLTLTSGLPPWRQRAAIAAVGAVGAVRAEAIRPITSCAPAALWGVQWGGMLKELGDGKKDYASAFSPREEEEETRAGSTNSDSEADILSIAPKSPPDSTRNTIVGPVDLNFLFPRMETIERPYNYDSEAESCRLIALDELLDQKPRGLQLELMLSLPTAAADHQRLRPQARPYVPQAVQSGPAPMTLEPKVVPPPVKPAPEATRSKLRSQAVAYVPKAVMGAPGAPRATLPQDIASIWQTKPLR